MGTSYPSYVRFEPRSQTPDFADGIGARVHDPLWFLARQWQMGEHQGENASTPVWLDYDVSSRPVQYPVPAFDPRVVPAEALVESETDDWWTMGRRLRAGAAIASARNLPDDASLRFADPPAPYEHFTGFVDGLALWRRRADLGLTDADFPATVPAETIPAWDASNLVYQQTPESAFTAPGLTLQVSGHRGGRMDWYSVDAVGAADPAVDHEARSAVPTRLEYPGAPLAGWWEIEDPAQDIGAYAPDSSHSATAIMTELYFSHSDEWFVFPVMGTAGSLLAIHDAAVQDSFGRNYASMDADGAGNLLWPGLLPPQDWTVFQTDGLAAEDLLLWHVAEIPLESGAVERVQFGLDDESNLLWAVERVVEGHQSRGWQAESPAARFNAGSPNGNKTQRRVYAYLPGDGAAPHWIPYDIDDLDQAGALIQRRLVDYSRQVPEPMPLPQSRVLSGGPEIHRINPSSMPGNGIEVERRWQLARDMNGLPVLWLQRQRRSLLAPPARRLRFDVVEPANYE
ncbi:hypothetical protein VUN84_08265 [Micrococcaceae bacterium Sec5.8]